VEAAPNPVRPAPTTLDRSLYRAIHGLPHSPATDRWGAAISDAGEGLGWVIAGIGLAWLGGPRGRRAGIATALASLSATYLVQRVMKPVFRRRRPFVDREVLVVGIKPADASFPSGHTAASFAAATALATFYPGAAPMAFTLATGVGLSRVYLGHHFPGDVAVGAMVGGGIGTAIAWALRLADRL
jgi:membrane-associated phospholipid phosphatase